MDPLRTAKVRKIFDNANFVRDLGIELTRVQEDGCETRLQLAARHLQQHGLVHAGVLATMADHTGGCAARGAVGLDQEVLTVEFKINFLRPAVGDRLRCWSRVLRAGKTLAVAESEIFAAAPSGEKLVAKATITLALVPEQ